jgi:hypothetical protein
VLVAPTAPSTRDNDGRQEEEKTLEPQEIAATTFGVSVMARDRDKKNFGARMAGDREKNSSMYPSFVLSSELWKTIGVGVLDRQPTKGSTRSR